MGKAGTNRVIKLTDNNGNAVSLNEGAVLFAVANSTTGSYTDITYLQGPHRKVKETFRRSTTGIMNSTENLISVTIDGITTLINVNRVEKAWSADGTLSGACSLMYDLDGQASKKLTLSQTLQEFNEKVWATVETPASES